MVLWATENREEPEREFRDKSRAGNWGLRNMALPICGLHGANWLSSGVKKSMRAGKPDNWRLMCGIAMTFQCLNARRQTRLPGPPRQSSQDAVKEAEFLHLVCSVSAVVDCDELGSQGQVKCRAFIESVGPTHQRLSDTRWGWSESVNDYEQCSGGW